MTDRTCQIGADLAGWIEHADAPEAQPAPVALATERSRSQVSGSREAVDAIRNLVAAADDAAVEEIFAEAPDLLQPGLVALLLDRARRWSSLGRQAPADHLIAVASKVAGCDNLALLEAVASLAEAEHRLTMAVGPGDPGTTLLLAVAQRTTSRLMSLTSVVHLRPAFEIRLFELVATVSSKAAELDPDGGWHQLAVVASRRAVELCPAGDVGLPFFLNNLSIRLTQGRVAAVQPGCRLEALRLAQHSVDLTAAHDPNLAARLNNLANRCYDLFVDTGSSQLLNDAIDAASRALEAAQGQGPTHVQVAQNLARLESVRGRATGAPVSPVQSTWPNRPATTVGPTDRVAKARQALLETDPSQPELADRLADLSDALLLRYRATADQDSLAESASVARRSVATTPPGARERPARLDRLAAQLTELHRVRGDPASLTEAVTVSIQAVLDSPIDELDTTARLGLLVERLSDAGPVDIPSPDLVAALEAARRVVRLSTAQGQDLADRRALVAAMVLVLHARRGRPVVSGLEEAKALIGELEPGSRELQAFADQCRHHLTRSDADADLTIDQSALLRTSEALAWITSLPTARTEPTPAAQPAVEEPKGQDWSHRLPRPPSGSTIVLLKVQIWVLFLVPAGLRIQILGAIGTPSLLIALGLMLMWLVSTLSADPQLGRPSAPLRATLAVFWIANLISYGLAHRFAVVADESSNSDRYLITLVAFTGLALFTAEGVKTREDQVQIIRAIVSGSAVMSLIALTQARLGFDVTQYYNKVPGLTTYHAIGGVFARDGLSRPAGTATHPIEFGVVVGCSLALAIHLVLHDHDWPRSRRWTAALLLGLGIPIAISRSALLVALVVLIVFFVDATRRQRIIGLQILAVLMLFVFMFVPGLIGTLRSYILPNGGDSSLESRTSDYSALAPYLRAHPWFGRGPGTFLPRIRIVDNQYLVGLVETGVVGVLSLLAIYSMPAWLGSASRARFSTDADRHLGRMLLAIGFAIVVASATFDAMAFPLYTMVVALAAGLAASHWSRALDGAAVAATPEAGR